jgi:FkbM family methyltransferase
MIYNRQNDLPYPQPWEYILDNIFKGEKGLTYIDVGANDGLTVSNTAYMELDLDWNGICIEPHPEAFSRLESNRNCIKYNLCISNTEEYIDFYQVTGYAEMLSGIKSEYDPKHIDRIKSEIDKNGGDVNIIKVKSTKLNSILEENNITKVDYLSIDTEGSELSVLKSIDLDKYHVKVISSEHCGYNDDVKNYLIEKGYKFIEKVCADEIYIKE